MSDIDIVERLRDMWGGVPESYVGKLRAEAADEIERLMGDLAWIAATIDLALCTESEDMDYRRLLNNLRRRATRP